MEQYRDFMDMIDGGGAGKMGDRFEGAGLLSLLANVFAKPYGSEDEERRKRLMQSRGVLDMAAPPAPPAAAPVKRVAQLSPRLDTKGMTPARPAPAPSYATMPMGEVGRGVAPNPLANMPATNFMDMMRNAPKQQSVPFGGYEIGDPFQRAAKELADQLGNAFYMMPMKEQLLRIQQRVDQMRGM